MTGVLPADWISAVESAHRKNRALAAPTRDRVPDSRSSGPVEFQGEMPRRIHISEVVVRRHLASQVPRAAHSRQDVGVERGLPTSVLAVSEPLGAIAHFDRFSSETDDPIQARVRPVTGKPECDQVPALDAVEATGNLAREDPRSWPAGTGRRPRLQQRMEGAGCRGPRRRGPTATSAEGPGLSADRLR